MYRPFQSKTKVSKTFTVLKEVTSLDARREHVRGVGNIRQTETMLSPTQNQLTLPPVKYQACLGGTYGDGLGPVVWTPQEQQWHATWSVGRISSSTWGGGGGRWGQMRRNPSARIPAPTRPSSQSCFHSLPTSFFTDLSVAFHIVGVIDLCAGEGTCAMAC